MSTQRARPPILARSLIPAALLFAACSNSSGGGGGGNKKVVVEVEPNDTSAEALALGDDVPGVGDVATAGDVDFWSAALQAGWVIQVEVLATRATQAEWDANDNIPRLTLYDTDGTTRLLEHDNSGNTTTTGSWDWDKHDLDFPMFRVPAERDVLHRGDAGRRRPSMAAATPCAGRA